MFSALDDAGSATLNVSFISLGTVFLSLPLPFKGYSLRPKKLVILGFKIYPKKQVILPYLESACAYKNQLVPNMGNK